MVTVSVGVLVLTLAVWRAISQQGSVERVLSIYIIFNSNQIRKKISLVEISFMMLHVSGPQVLRGTPTDARSQMRLG